MTSLKKNLILHLSIIIGILSIVYFSVQLCFINTEDACAKVKYESSIKGRRVMVYFYKYKGEIYKGNFGIASEKCLKLECYKDVDCLEIEVSTIFPSMSRLKVKSAEE